MPKTTLKEAGGPDSIQAVRIAIGLLEKLAFGGKFGRVTDLAKELGTSKNRVHRYLKALEELGYVAQEEDTQRYMVGVRFVQVGNAVATEYDFLSVSRPIMERLRDALGFSIVLSQVDRGRLFAIEQVQGRGEVTFSITVGSPLRLHNSAQGKIVLAFGDPSLLAATLAEPLTPRTPATIVDPEKLRLEVAKARERGWAIAPGEIMSGINAAAVPIFDHRGKLFGTLATVASIDDLPGDPGEKHLSLLKQAAADISASLPMQRSK
ncbi:IclR family transcriptional regulator [Rhodoligotrophos defluvii]|uniref:IclR family transcriptional regulator n=1 Tax=Rhodoligotrophos defluvii TaxID=2561934 RepID=UPI001485A989|nr:IclR family transcriptional regulator [Rhodoligotrophos defluvii]